MADRSYAFDVDQAGFEREVVDRSRQVPVVVDFWAAWCGPCRTLGPILERAVAARAGAVLLARVDVDHNRRLAATYQVRGIPAVKGFRNGRVVAEFVGAQPPGTVEAFLDRLIPSDADRLAGRALRLLQEDPQAAEAAFREALAAEPGHRVAAIELARLLADRDPDQALELVAPYRPDPAAEQVAVLAELCRSGGDVAALRRAVEAAPDDAEAKLGLGRALAATGRYEEAVEYLLAAVESGGPVREDAREQLVALFRLVGESEPLIVEARKRLANVLY